MDSSLKHSSLNHSSLYKLQGIGPTIDPTVYIAPGAKIIGDVRAAEHVSIWFNAVLRADSDTITIGKNTNVQDGTIIHVDPGFPVTIGDNVTIGHRAIIHGCTIHDGALIGMGATIMNGAVIGAGALVAAGAVVTEGTVVEPGTLVAGIPAKPLRKLSDEHMKHMAEGAQHYVERGRQYQHHLDT